MAGLLSEDCAHRGTVQSGSYSCSEDKQEGNRHWYFSRKDIEESSPSRRDGVDLKKESYLRKSYCTFLQDLGMRLKVPQVTIATAIVFSHRFFLHQSHATNDRRTIATVCMFLAGKVEETPRPLKDVIVISYEIMHNKDPAAVQRIKQKEVYEQQKELILLAERVVLATLGFDLNIHHPYKSLVEAIKKLKVAQNSLAQVAWNFVNDGLRTSLCLQFKPHHIAAGAIFLAAKFLKVKLPSEGEVVWWREYDVTSRQLEEVSNQMLELYEQNKIPVSQRSEIEGSAVGRAGHQAPTKPLNANQRPVSEKHHSQVGLVSAVKRKSLSTWSELDQGGPKRNNHSRIESSHDYGSTETKSDISEHRLDDEIQDHTHLDQQSLPNMKNRAEDASDTFRFGSKDDVEGLQKENCRSTAVKLEQQKDGTASCKLHNEVSEKYGVPVLSPEDSIKKFDKEKVKAALEKRKKSRGVVTQKKDLMDDDDLIEQELEDGIELAVEDRNAKQENKAEWLDPFHRPDLEIPIFVDDHVSIGQRNYVETEEHNSMELNVAVAEEGELSLSDDADKFHSSKSSSPDRKAEIPDGGVEGHDFTSTHLGTVS